MANVIVAPNYVQKNMMPRVFLAGGITDCPDWQSEVIPKLMDLPIEIFNPRRSEWSPTISNADESVIQIKWEWQYLALADVILFWFPQETVCPITLLEYGKFLVSIPMKPLFVGTHPNYQRRMDIEIQTKLERSLQLVHNDLDDVVDQMIGYLKNMILLP